MKEILTHMTFVPNKPESMVLVKIFKREAVLLAKLRRYSYGKFTIDKVNGLIMRLVINESQNISEDDDTDLS